jgi:hypothetical protein
VLALGYSFDETGEAIGKSGNAVAERRYNGGLIPDQIIRSVDRSLLRSRPWSSGEDELLMLLTAHDWDSVRIAKVLSRSSASIESRKNDKGIRGHRCAAKQSRAGIWRACTMCRERFLSEGIHNRVCLPCKETEVWRYGGA